MLLICAPAASAAAGGVSQTMFKWEFNEEKGWNGWTPGHALRNARFDATSVRFDTLPQAILTSPWFELEGADNGARVEVDFECDGPGIVMLYFTNKREGKYGGFEPPWMARMHVPAAGRRILRFRPFWQRLGKINRIRFDPPVNRACRLHSISIVVPPDERNPLDGVGACSVKWWENVRGADPAERGGELRVRATEPQALVLSAVEPFEACRRSVLRLDAEVSDGDAPSFYWAGDGDAGLFGIPLAGVTRSSSGEYVLDLRRFSQWHGRITHVGLAFGRAAGATLRMRSLAVEANDPERPLVRVLFLGPAEPLPRAGRPMEIRAILAHAAGPPWPGGAARLAVEGAAECATPVLEVPAMNPGDRCTIRGRIVPRAAGDFRLRLVLGEEETVRTVHVEPAIAPVAAGEYEVPPPRPVRTPYEIGIYYFPGWSPASGLSRWKFQAGFPERDPALGWYEEGSPVVADWQIKWALENGITFFIFDWYWRDGREELGEGLNEGFLRVRYCDSIRFAVMWANHPPFDNHSEDQLLEVTDYWIERYFRRPNYLRMGDRPYVSFFSPHELVSDLGSEEAVRKAFDRMRERARAAGLPGIHIAACGGMEKPDLERFRRCGFDSVTAYNYLDVGLPVAQFPYRHYMAAHEGIWRRLRDAAVLPYVPLLTVGWDSRPWHGPQAQARFDRRTEYFREGLEGLKRFLDESGSKTAILEAWNEWGEGSYLGPNVEFGFGDLEAVRAVFADPGPWPANVGPADVGAAGVHDLRGDGAGARAAMRYGSPVKVEGVRPGVVEGLELRCWEDRVAVARGKIRVGGEVREIRGGVVRIEPADETAADPLPMRIVGGEVDSWLGGNRLIIGPKNRRNVLPGSYRAGSLRLFDPEDPGAIFEEGRDYEVDDVWGAFSIVEGGILNEGRTVTAYYRYTTRRVDVLGIDPGGDLRVIRGESSPDCPPMPEVPEGFFVLANIYRPFGSTTVKPSQVYVPTGAEPDRSPIVHPALKPVLEKLRSGGEVTIVCWGDSVTAGGEASDEAHRFVGLFERMLRERFPGASIRVINAGVGASNTEVRLPHFQEEVLDFHPDLVTLEFINDMSFPEDVLQERYEEILRRTREAGAELLLLTPHFAMPEWMGLPDGRGPDRRHAVAFLRRFAEENGVPLADAARRWEMLEAQGIPYEIYLHNGINHPDDRGHRIFAEEMMRFFPR